eukprot:Gregarina_sp_Poly_1__3016@NODE_1847_length_3213_cov_87_893516_g1199_i0_p1_GENE_NODE_1847_length_3213_cov_87_893516_g1199_i0NODE_1847_length_3213_cov_87_893516_g1199_i0_p1_ORF_typecomplete_len477_score91_04PRP38/PF03371_15/5_5e48_NODE_1847_length_3213_cov_87_893516_g1199_i017483178
MFLWPPPQAFTQQAPPPINPALIHAPQAFAPGGVPQSLTDLSKCHLHTKPLLSCKFCRKFKMAVHHQARLAKVQLLQGFTSKRDCLEMTNTSTFNLNPLLRENILASEYFKSLYSFNSLPELMEEIRRFVDHIEPYCAGNTRAPSTFLCCLYKLFTMKLTEDELLTLMDDDNIFVRVTAYVWLRFVHPPEKLWGWYESLFLDDTSFNPYADKSPQNETTIGEFVESLLTEDRYFSTVLPRLPVKVKTQYGLQLVTLGQHRRRKQRNKGKIWKFKRGVDVMACYHCEWRYGKFDSFYEDDIFGGNFALVKFSEEIDGEDEPIPIDLGLVIVLNKKNKRRRLLAREAETQLSGGEDEAGGLPSESGGPGAETQAPTDPSPSTGGAAESMSPQISTEDLMAEFRKKERERALASGKDYAKRPSSYKASLSVKLGHGPKSSVAGRPKTSEVTVPPESRREAPAEATNDNLEKLKAKYQSS